MRTSVDIPDDLLMRAKRAALERRSTLKELIAKGLERELAEGADLEAGYRVRLPLISVSADCPAVHLSIDDIKAIEAEQESEAHRDLLARR